jgi:hypothetical protein
MLVGDLDRKVHRLARRDVQVRRFMTVPGVGPITRTVLQDDDQRPDALHVAQICDRLFSGKRLRHRCTDAYRSVRCEGRSHARHLELATLRWKRRRYARKAYMQLRA